MHINYRSGNLYPLEKIPVLNDRSSSKPYLNLKEMKGKPKGAVCIRRSNRVECFEVNFCRHMYDLGGS